MLRAAARGEKPRASERTPASAGPRRRGRPQHVRRTGPGRRPQPATPVSCAEIVDAADDPLAAVAGITTAAYADQTGFLLPNCHGIMHTVAREYALRPDLTLAELKDNLPRRTTRAARPVTPTGSSPPSRPRSSARPDGRRPAVREPRPATSATAARTASATPSCGSATTRSPRRCRCALSSARRRARLRPGRLPRLLVRGQRDRRRPRSPRSRSPSRARCAARSPRSSCARAGTARSWRPRRGRAPTPPRTSRTSAAA